MTRKLIELINIKQNLFKKLEKFSLDLLKNIEYHKRYWSFNKNYLTKRSILSNPMKGAETKNYKMKINRIKLLTLWKNNSILTYHIGRAEGAFKVDQGVHPSLSFLKICWIKKWSSFDQLRQAELEILSKIITISIGGIFVNYLAHPSLEEEQNLIFQLNGIGTNLYGQLVQTLFLFCGTVEQLKNNKC